MLYEVITDTREYVYILEYDKRKVTRGEFDYLGAIRHLSHFHDRRVYCYAIAFQKFSFKQRMPDKMYAEPFCNSGHGNVIMRNNFV